MRLLLCSLPVLGLATASAAPASDPAFLGIGMTNAPGYCSINNVTDASPADEAGIQFGDMVLAIDGQPLGGPQPCDMLQTKIVAHRPGEDIKLDVRRGAERIVIRATLSTRAEVLNRRLVGVSIRHTELSDIDNAKLSYDLAGAGRTTILGWFTLEACTNCGRVFDRVTDALKKRLKDGTVPATIAITAPGRRGSLADIRKSFTANVSLAVAEPELFEQYSLRDSERISFMVIDCRGVIQFVKPVAPDAEDVEAALDDMLAAVEQAEHQRTSRRN